MRRFVAGGALMGLGAWIAVLAAYGFSGLPLPAPLLEGVRFQIADSPRARQIYLGEAFRL